jgi:hypothetical protein
MSEELETYRERVTAAVFTAIVESSRRMARAPPC